MIREMNHNDHDRVLAIVRSLGDWFDADARERAIPIDLRHQSGFVAVESDDVVGFITLYVAEGRLRIGWLGVKPNRHRRGIGGALLAGAEALALRMGLSELETFTLGPGVAYPPYEQTRAFYAKHGFQVIQTSTTDNPGCPEEIRIVKRIDTPSC